MEAHIRQVTKVCYFHLKRIARIRQYITDETAATLVRSLILSCLDYANAVLVGLLDTVIYPLQLVQNNAARVVLRKKKRDSAT